VTDFQLGVLCATVIWVVCIVVYLCYERRYRKRLNGALAELAEAIAEAAKGDAERRARLLSELEELERMVERRT